MTGKDILTLILVAYGFNDIEINTYRGSRNAQGYIIHASNKEANRYYYDENCEGLMFNITHIIRQMEEEGIEATYNQFTGHEYTIKEIIDKVRHNV